MRCEVRGKLGRESHQGCEEEDGERGRREESTAKDRLEKEEEKEGREVKDRWSERSKCGGTEVSKTRSSMA